MSASISRAAGGIYEIERRLSQELARHSDVSIGVFGTRDEFTDDDLPQWAPLQPQAFATKGPRAFGYAPGLLPALEDWRADLAHLHSLWMHPSVVVRQWAARGNRPTVITANGMLEPSALNHSRWKKRAALLLFERGSLRRAGCIQVNTPAEAASVRALGLSNPIAIIPNGVDPAGEGAAVSPPWTKGRKVLLFLGRIHPKKGLVPLVQAWSQRRGGDDWILAIAGWNQGEHEQELKTLAGGRTDVVFLGPQFGPDKDLTYRACDAFILPSFSEGLPMAVLEAWAYRKPVLMTPGCNLSEGFAAGAAMRIEPEATNIAAGLGDLFALAESERRSMGERGGRLVAERFSWPRVAEEMRAVYHWLLDGAGRPDCLLPN